MSDLQNPDIRDQSVLSLHIRRQNGHHGADVTRRQTDGNRRTVNFRLLLVKIKIVIKVQATGLVRRSGPNTGLDLDLGESLLSGLYLATLLT